MAKCSESATLESFPLLLAGLATEVSHPVSKSLLKMFSALGLQRNNILCNMGASGRLPKAGRRKCGIKFWQLSKASKHLK